jgi:16S rRNA (guanine(527)-N(7))-methyltransferase RsmG
VAEQRRSFASRVSRETVRTSIGRRPPLASRKRPSDPEQIGTEVSAIVEAEAGRLGLDLTAAFFSRMRMYATLLAVWGEKMSLTARPHDPADLAFHVLDSLTPIALAADGKLAGLDRCLKAGREVVDLGSGAGFPGLVLASASRAHFTLCEARRKRTSFLTVTAEELGLFDLTIKGDRVMPSSFTSAFDLLTTRALGEAGNFYGVAKAALRRGGLAMLYASPRQAADFAARRIAGFELIASEPYELSRDRETVARSMLLWRKL